MGKFYNVVGYVIDTESAEHPGAVFEEPVERFYKGDLLENNRRLESSDEKNDDITLSNRISIVADAYAYSHFFSIRYVKWMGGVWKVTKVDVEPPRLILTFGGVYNGKTKE